MDDRSVFLYGCFWYPIILLVLITPFMFGYSTYKIYYFGDIEYVTVKSDSTNLVKLGKDYYPEYEFKIEEGDVDFSYSMNKIGTFKIGQKLPIHTYYFEDGNFCKVYTGSEEKSWYQIFTAQYPLILLILLPGLFFLIFFILIISIYVRAITKMITHAKSKSIEEGTLVWLNYFTSFSIFIISVFLTGIIIKALLFQITQVESHGILMIGLYLFLIFIGLSIIPYLFDFGIRKVKEGSHKYYKNILLGVGCFTAINIIVVLAKAFLDNNPDSFRFNNLLKILLDIWTDILS